MWAFACMECMYDMHNLILGKRAEDRGGERKKKQPATVLPKGKEREKRKEKGKERLNTTLFSLFYFFLSFSFP